MQHIYSLHLSQNKTKNALEMHIFYFSLISVILSFIFCFLCLSHCSNGKDDWCLAAVPSRDALYFVKNLKTLECLNYNQNNTEFFLSPCNLTNENMYFGVEGKIKSLCSKGK